MVGMIKWWEGCFGGLVHGEPLRDRTKRFVGVAGGAKGLLGVGTPERETDRQAR